MREETASRGVRSAEPVSVLPWGFRIVKGLGRYASQALHSTVEPTGIEPVTSTMPLDCSGLQRRTISQIVLLYSPIITKAREGFPSRRVQLHLNGDPEFHDSWHDIVGYAKLVADSLASTNPLAR
jgi:hypothetical protein